MDTKAQEAFVEDIKELVAKGAIEVAIEATVQNEEAVKLLATQFVTQIQQYEEMLKAHEAQEKEASEETTIQAEEACDVDTTAKQEDTAEEVDVKES